MEKEKNKGIIALIIVLIVIILGLSGYIVYDKVLKVEEPAIKEEVKEEVKEVDFYDVSELVKNKYIQKIESIYGGNSDNKVIEIKENKVYVVSDISVELNFDLVEAKGIEGKPKYVYFDATHAMSNSIFVVLTEEGDLYYANIIENDGSGISHVSVFKKVNDEKVKDMYSIVNVDKFYGTYPYEYNSIYFETESGKLINLQEGKIGKTFEENWPYPDAIFGCGICFDSGCANSLYFSSEKVLYNEKISEEKSFYEKVNYNNKEIVAKDAFTVCNYSEQGSESGKYESNYYIVGEDNYIYKINSVDNDVKKVELYKESRVQSFEYDFDESDDVRKITTIVEYENGEKEKFDNVSHVSTLYHRYNK